ncbi:MAG: hypothetical protein FWG31_02990 [Oscillospiraceae bacterium]|nr:hypothetical protein [Oscillospiraceae bacterium]
MEQDVKNITKDLLGTAKAKGYNTGQIENLMASPEGQALMAQLSAPGGEGMKDAAAKAAAGDTAALSSLLRTLMATPEGQSIAKQVMNMKKDG